MNAVTFPPKLPQLVRLLASDHDGEVVAAARAIGRALDSAGLSFHDLADRLSFHQETKTPHAPKAKAWHPISGVRWADLDSVTQTSALHGLKRHPALTSWERDFVVSVLEIRARSRRPLSDRQTLVLDQMLAKASAWEAPRP